MEDIDLTVRRVLSRQDSPILKGERLGKIVGEDFYQSSESSFSNYYTWSTPTNTSPTFIVTENENSLLPLTLTGWVDTGARTSISSTNLWTYNIPNSLTMTVSPSANSYISYNTYFSTKPLEEKGRVSNLLSLLENKELIGYSTISFADDEIEEIDITKQCRECGEIMYARDSRYQPVCDTCINKAAKAEYLYDYLIPQNEPAESPYVVRRWGGDWRQEFLRSA